MRPRFKTIIYLHPHFIIEGGAGQFVLQTGRLLSARGYRVIVITIRASDAIVGAYRDSIEFVEIGGPLSSQLSFWLLFPFSCFRVFSRLKKYSDYILFLQVFPANWWGFWYKFFHPRLKTVWMCQEPSAFIHSPAWIKAVSRSPAGNCAGIFNPLLKLIDCRLARLTDFVFTNSLYGRDAALSIYGYPPHKVKAVYLGTNSLFSGQSSQSPRPLQIITVGRLTGFKNIDVILEALVVLKQTKGTEAVLKVVGKGEQEERLRKLAQRLGIERQVHFCGSVSVEMLAKLYASSRALVLASVDEPFGLVAIEAMACGTPAVVVGSGGPAETVIDGGSGFHVKARDPEDLAEKLQVLLCGEEVFERFSAGAVERAKDFTWEKTVQALEAGFAGLDGVQ